MEMGARPLLAEVYVNDYNRGGTGTYVRLVNPNSAPVALSGSTLEWGAQALPFPEGATMAADSSCYIARNADGFRQEWTRLPDFTLSPFPGVPTLGSGLDSTLGVQQGHVRLLSRDGQVLDAIVWGDAALVVGWSGPTLAPLAEGLVYQRAIDEETLTATSPGSFVLPGGTASAWKQGGAWLTRRLMRVGQGTLGYPSFTADSAVTFVTPDAGFDAVSSFLDSARNSLLINLYLMTQDALAERVEAALKRGVAVRLLMEGQPMEGMPPRDRENIDQLQHAGAQVRIMREGSDGFKRYHFDHAKYAVADGHLCLVMSDNWSRTSVPVTPQTGNRGWGTVLESPELAAHLTRIFTFDWNPMSPDSVLLDPSIKMPDPVPSLLGEMMEPAALQNPIQPIRVEGPISITPVIAPEHALLEAHGICGLIRSATQRLDVQQADLQLFWGYDQTGSRETMPNLFLEEVVAAARRGVKVRVLMGGAFLHEKDPRDNLHTQEYLRGLAASEHLQIESRILDYSATRMSIHNKGLIADEARVLICSVNWTQNSPLNNREVGLIADHPAMAAYFGSAFERDWAGGK